MPPRGLPHHDQEKIARDGNYYLYCGLENRPNKTGVFVYEKLYYFSITAIILTILSIL